MKIYLSIIVHIKSRISLDEKMTQPFKILRYQHTRRSHLSARRNTCAHKCHILSKLRFHVVEFYLRTTKMPRASVTAAFKKGKQLIGNKFVLAVKQMGFNSSLWVKSSRVTSQMKATEVVLTFAFGGEILKCKLLSSSFL